MRCLLAIATLSLAAAGQDLKNLPSGGPPMDLAFQVGHTEWPGRFDISVDGARLVTASGTRVIVWERTTHAQTHVFDRPARQPEQPWQFMHPVKFSPSGQHVFMFGTAIWDLTTQYYSARLPPHRCSCAAWSPGGRRLLTGTAAKKDAKGTTALAILWDATTGERLHQFSQPGKNITHVDWSADGTKLLTATKASCYVWDAKTHKRVLFYNTPCDGAIFHPDSKQLLLWHKTVSFLMRIRDGKGDKQFGFRWRRGGARAKGEKEFTYYDIKPASFNMAPAFSPDGRLLVQYHAYEPNHTLAVWDVKTRKVLRKLHGGNGPWHSMFTRDGKDFVILTVPGAGQNSLYSWDTKEWKRRRFGPRKEVLAEIWGVRFRGNDELFVSTVSNQAMLVSLATADRRLSFSRFGAGNLRLTADGRRVVASLPKGAVVWDAGTGREALLETARPFEMTRVLFPSAEHLITLGKRYTEKPSKIGKWMDKIHEGTEVVFWNLKQEQIEHSFMLPRGSTIYMLSVLGGRRLIATESGRKVIAFDGESGKEVARFGNPLSAAALKVPTPNSRYGTSIMTNPAGTLLLGSSYWEAKGWKAEGDHSTIIWELPSGKRIGVLKHGPPVVFSPDGTILATRDWDKKETALWSIPSLRRIAVFGHVRPAGFSADGEILIIRTKDRAGLVDMKTMQPRRVFPVGESQTTWGQPSDTKLNALSPDGKRLVTVRNSGQAMIWDATTGRKLATLVVLNGGADWLLITPQGYYHGTDAARQFVAWRIEGVVFPVDLYNKRYHRPDLVAKVLRGEPLPKGASISGAHRPPMLRIDIVSIKHDHVMFRARARPGSKGAKITALQVFVDGRDISAERQKQILREKRRGEVFFTGRIDFPPGKTKAIAAAVATDEYGLQSRPAIRVIVRPGPATSVKRSLYVLTAGVSKYKDRGSNLNFPHRDAEQLAALLKKQEGLAFDNVHVRLLTNEKATRANIIEGIRWLRKNCGRADIAILHFGGHGYRDRKGRLYYVPHDADMRKPATTLLSWDDVAKDLRHVQAAQMLFFSDCCHSGAFGQQALSQNDLVRTLLNEARMMVFASSRGSEVSYEMGHLKAGAFSYAIVKGLSGHADIIKDGRITVSELQLYVADQVKKLTWDRQHPHIPRMNDFDPEMVIAHVK